METKKRVVCRRLNRLIIAGQGETMALNSAVRLVDGSERRARLREQAERRLTFQRDLTAAVTALGGAPASHPAAGARLAAGARRVHELLVGPHEGDAYAVCARATEKTATACSMALKLELPADVRFGLERQYAEIEWDHRELRRLRWGASPTPLPSRSPDAQSVRSNASALREADDARALETWSEEGGSGPSRPTIAKPGAGVAGAMQ
jgi:uncharacterized protein (TIGR02284 family)